MGWHLSDQVALYSSPSIAQIVSFLGMFFPAQCERDIGGMNCTNKTNKKPLSIDFGSISGMSRLFDGVDRFR
jgi:hypothetical protein